MEECVFCKIAGGVIPTKVVFQNDDILAFPDMHPQAPTHILVIPKKHVRSLNEIDDDELIIKMIKAAKQIAINEGVYDKGYRLVLNTGKEGGQVIQHLHMHLLGGKQLKG